MFQPSPQAPSAPAEPSQDQTAMSQSATQDAAASGPSPEEIEKHFDSLPDDAKSFLAAYMTPELVQAIALISGTQVAKYLDQFADKDKVLVPVPRQMAEQYLAEQQKQGSSAPQGSPQQPSMPIQSAAPGPQAPSAPARPAPQAMMTPPRPPA